MTGWSAGARAALAQRVHGSVEYSLARTQWNPRRRFGVHDSRRAVGGSAAVRADPRRVGVGGNRGAGDLDARPRAVPREQRVRPWRRQGADSPALAEHPAFDSRFDVQVRQSLPFLNFSTARWEMLLAVHNFFRETAADQSIYDELLVVHPPKRVVGGLTLRF